MGYDTVDPFQPFCSPQQPLQLPQKFASQADSNTQSQITHNLMNKKMGVKQQPQLAEQSKALPRHPLSLPQTLFLPNLPRPKEASAVQPEDLGKRTAADERWDFEAREIHKKLSAVKSSGSRS